MFSARGPRDAPDDVVVVSIDKQSAHELGLPNEPHRWPRRLHAQLVDRLHDAGARAIGFDVMFKQPQTTEDDDALADAIARAGNVLLFSYLDVRGMDPKLRIENIQLPLPGLLAQARGAAIFPLPKFPKRVNQVWTFKAGAGGVPTFPVVMTQLADAELYPEWVGLPAFSGLELPATLADAVRGPGLITVMTKMRGRWRELSQENVPPPLKQLRTAYSAPESIYLNYYGPARTLPTIPYYRALQETRPEWFKGKAVFIGLSEPLQTDQLDTFHTVFSQPDGVDLGGVEISATAYANIRAGDWIRPLPQGAALALVLLWAIIVTFICQSLPTAAAVGGAIVVSGVYFGAALSLFSVANIWLPIFVPLALQTPVALFGVTLARYFEESREKRRVRDALQRYLPAGIIDEIADDIAAGRQTQHLVYGTCVATDAEHYTALSEKMSPPVLSQFMNRYYGALFPIVARRGGFVSDIVGDAMMAIWTSLNAPDVRSRQSACQAAIELQQSVDKFNRDQPLSLPTRIGIHAGEMALGNIGAGEHYEYRAVGDMVNTAARVQGLNKTLGTRILATEDAMQGVEGLAVRRLGRFRLAGKSQAVGIVELIGISDRLEREAADRIARFERARQLFLQREWERAEAEFDLAWPPGGADGPIEFFTARCREFQAAPPAADWDGTVSINIK